MGYRRMSWLQQILYVMVHRLGEFERNRWQFILYGKSTATRGRNNS